MHMKKKKTYLHTAQAKKIIKSFRYYISILVLCILITKFSFAFVDNNVTTLFNSDNSSTLVTEALGSQYVNLDLSPSSVLALQMPFISYKALAEETNSLQVISAFATADNDEGDDSESARELSEKLTTEILSSIDNTDISTSDIFGSEPKVLIYHTHTEESYLLEGEAVEASTTFRSTNKSIGVCAVGEALASELKSTYGISVIHDTTDHEPPYLGTAYERSLKTIQQYKAKYPSLEIFIDIHRDGYSVAQLASRQNDYVVVDGKECAKIMLVVGNGKGSSGQGFSVMPKYEENYKLAAAVTNKLNGIQNGLAKTVLVKTGRYNQHVSTKCMLIEVGHNGNTITQALNSVPYVARAIYESLSG